MRLHGPGSLDFPAGQAPSPAAVELVPVLELMGSCATRGPGMVAEGAGQPLPLAALNLSLPICNMGWRVEAPWRPVPGPRG